MGWEDRPYYRSRGAAFASPFLWLLTGSVPLFTAFGIRVRAHASLLLLIGLTILLDWQDNYPLQIRAFSMAVLFSLVILHEFGHCFAARRLGGTADEVLLWPLGGLAMTDPPHAPLPRFLTSAAGPAVNLLICVICAFGVYFTTPTLAMRLYGLGHATVPLNPFHPLPGFPLTMGEPVTYFWWIFYLSYLLLLFNILPIYPMDGGQMLQAALWPVLGNYRSMMFSTMAGMVGSVALALAIVLVEPSQWLMILFCAWLFYECYRQRLMTRENGPEDWHDSIDYAASIYGHDDTRKRRRTSRRAARKAKRISDGERSERERIDRILSKVSAHGMHSLSWLERRALKRATEKHRRREFELSQFR